MCSSPSVVERAATMAGREKYLHETVLPESVSRGGFGGRALSFVRCELDSESTGVDQYASSVVFTRAILAEPGGAQVAYPLIVKFQPTDPFVKLLMNSDFQFHNEVTMYREILPKFAADIVSSIFPNFYYGLATLGEEPEKDVVVLEDLKGKGFKLTEERVFLDYDHVVLALKALGEFHALSYILKRKDPDLFEELKSKLKEHVWDRPDTTDNLMAHSVINFCVLRGVNRLLEQDPCDETLKNLKGTFENCDTRSFMKNLVKPEEPTAVVCHGDFLRNNILFAYDAETRRPKSVRFFDLQTSRYASPVIDITLLLWMNTTYELRAKHWEAFVRKYYDSMVNTAKAFGCSDVPTFEQLQEDLRRKGIYGYMHSSYFLPMCVSDQQPDIDGLAKATQEEVRKYMTEVGGEYGTRLVSEIVKHLVEFKYLNFP